MTDMRRPNRTPPGAQGRPRRPGEKPTAAARPGAREPGRRLAPKKAGTPLWMWLALIVSPIVLIVLLLTVPKGQEEAPVEKPKPKDPNVKISALEAQVPKFKATLSEIMELTRKEDPSTAQRREALIDSLDKWQSEWNEIFEQKRVDGRLPPELKAYERTQLEVNTLRNDISRTGGF
jgi:hypothetical protein